MSEETNDVTVEDVKKMREEVKRINGPTNSYSVSPSSEVEFKEVCKIIEVPDGVFKQREEMLNARERSAWRIMWNLYTGLKVFITANGREEAEKCWSKELLDDLYGKGEHHDSR
jgi:hypothetical protein